MKDHLNELFASAIDTLRRQGVLPAETVVDLRFDRTRQQEHGDLATNVALALAKTAGRKPRELAEAIVAALPASPHLARVEIAGPGFINLFLTPAAHFAVVDTIREQGEHYGCVDIGNGQRVLLEFVSANPTGPLHVGHGRGAAYGDTLARVLASAGYVVETEYYVNDAGRQMDILALSVWLRYLELCGEQLAFPDNAYQGDYIWDIAASLHREDGERYRHPGGEVCGVAAGLEPEAGLDALIDRAKKLLGPAAYRRVFDTALNVLLDDIRDDLAQFGVTYDRWFSERTLFEKGAIERAVERLKQTGHLYQKDDAWWFRSTAFGDEKDRVVVRENGVATYFASDIAYHLDKYERGYDQMIDIWGADHHGYVPRVKAAIAALGLDTDRLTVGLVQFAVLYRGGEKVSMSTRGGEFVTLRELRREVGADAARFFYVQRKSDQHMDFDLDLAKSQSADNPVYYVQYAHARICSVFKQAGERGIDLRGDERPDYGLLGEQHEIDLAAILTQFPETVGSAARQHEPHLIVYYLRELANGVHTYYNAHQFLTVEPALRGARLALIDAARRVLANGLSLLGVFAPQHM